ncbi:MAG: undecaprenyl diphosphate synthase family protein [Halobacteria archaeon]|nr:undecaprenyl diphosphate synthase family protein [Halobacteria archaeon]
METINMTFVYDWLLERKVKKRSLPEHIVLVINEADLLRSGGFATLDDFFGWCSELGIERVNVCVMLLEPNEAITSNLREGIDALDTEVEVHCLDDEVNGEGNDEKNTNYEVSLGIEGRNEFVDALRSVAESVEEGEIAAEDVDESVIEDNLIFSGEPDIILKTGGEHLSNFMIWQSVYSELHFADFNWQNLRRRDFLRAIRDFQDRERRYGE